MPEIALGEASLPPVSTPSKTIVSTILPRGLSAHCQTADSTTPTAPAEPLGFDQQGFLSRCSDTERPFLKEMTSTQMWASWISAVSRRPCGGGSTEPPWERPGALKSLEDQAVSKRVTVMLTSFEIVQRHMQVTVTPLQRTTWNPKATGLVKANSLPKVHSQVPC